MNAAARLALILLATVLLAPATVVSETGEIPQTATNALSDFERLIGSQWHLEGSYQEFEWGVGQRSVKARSYFVIDGAPRLVSEGIWYWHPGEESIKGVFTAINMPVDVFEYRTRFEGNKLISELAAYDASGMRTAYIETWEFTDDAHFTWSLFLETADGPRKEMGGIYTKK